MKKITKESIKEDLDIYKTILKATFIPFCVWGFIKGYSIEQNGNWDTEDRLLYMGKRILTNSIPLGIIAAFISSIYMNRVPINLLVPVYLNSTWNLTILGIGVLTPVLTTISNKLGEIAGGITYHIIEYKNNKENNQSMDEVNSYSNNLNRDSYSYYHYHKSIIKKPTVTEQKIELLETKKELLEEKKKREDITLKLKK